MADGRRADSGGSRRGAEAAEDHTADDGIPADDKVRDDDVLDHARHGLLLLSLLLSLVLKVLLVLLLLLLLHLWLLCASSGVGAFGSRARPRDRALKAALSGLAGTTARFGARTTTTPPATGAAD